jgi:hypothetical protein
MAKVFESIRILGNSYCYYPSEKMKKKKNIRQEDVGMVKVHPWSELMTPLESGVWTSE